MDCFCFVSGPPAANAFRGQSLQNGSDPLRAFRVTQRPNARAVQPPVMRRGKGFSGFGTKQLPRFKFTGKMRPGRISPRLSVPENIPRPNYARSGRPRGPTPKFPWDIEIKSAEDIEHMRVAGRLAREVLDAAGRSVEPGMLTDEIDRIVHEETIKRGAYPSPLNYNKFPKSCCTSINEIICHGIPDDTVLVNGDIINIDVTVFYNGFHGDCSEMFLVGDVDERGRQLVKTTYDCLQSAIAICKPGVPIKRIGTPIEKLAKENGFSVVRNFCGHGIGRTFHTTPSVLHCENSEPAGIMEAGMTFTIEPMINEGTHKNVTWPDDWTAATLDGKRSAQFEHTLLITEDGVEALTARLDDSPKMFWE